MKQKPIIIMNSLPFKYMVKVLSCSSRSFDLWVRYNTVLFSRFLGLLRLRLGEGRKLSTFREIPMLASLTF
jgi:hypothetical protein